MLVAFLVLIAATFTALGIPSRSKGVPNGWIEDIEEAKALSAKEGKHILVCSIRSDRKLEQQLIRDVFSQGKFSGKAKKRFILMMADLTDNTQNLSSVAMRQNSDIRKSYHLNGNGSACIVDCTGQMLLRLGNISGDAYSCWVEIDSETRELPAARKKEELPQQAAHGVSKEERPPSPQADGIPHGTAGDGLAAGDACAVAGDWKSALEHFKTTASRQGVIAKYELEGTANARQLANAWWKSVSLARDADTRSAYQAHAAALYQQALCEGLFEGERMAMAMQRIAEAEKAGVCSRPDNMVRCGRYCVIDLSAGPNAGKYPVFYLGSEPSSGWTDEYKTTKLVLRRIEPGSFIMGNDQTDESSRVNITKPFYMGVFEVTQKQYELVTGRNPSQYRGEMRPVGKLSFTALRGDPEVHNWPSVNTVDANSFIGRIRARTGLDLDLPPEAEWEYACRAGTKSKFNNGGDSEEDWVKVGRVPPNQSAFGWLEPKKFQYGHVPDGKGGDDSYCTTVGLYLPNAWGLYDMHGNSWEWTLGTRINRNGSNCKVLRGGGWNSPSYQCCSAGYYQELPERVGRPYGFRLSMSTPGGFKDHAVQNGRREGSAPSVATRPAVPPVQPSSKVSSDKLYCVINLSAGASATSYPVSYLKEAPDNEWPDEYKTKKLVLRRVEPGTFIVGNTGRRATIAKPYYIGVFEVTQSQWELVMGENPSSMKGAMRPVEGVSFNTARGGDADADAASFVGRLRARTSLDVDLPDPDRWEYACRAGTKSNFNNGCNSESDEMWQLGRFYLNQSLVLPKERANVSADGIYRRPDGRGGFRAGHTVAGSYLPNDWWLYDMHGNVAEMCLGTESQCVLRGGSWADSESRSGTCFLTSSASKTKSRDARENCIGLRLVIGISK